MLKKSADRDPQFERQRVVHTVYDRLYKLSVTEDVNLLHFINLKRAGIATGYGLDDQGIGFRIAMEVIIFNSPRRPDRLWDPPSFLSNM
jgi:ABC-type amino acid transport system permease subunit